MCSPCRVPSAAVKDELLAAGLPAGVVVALDLEAAAGAGQLDPAAGPAAVQRRKVSPPLGRKTVEHRADELQSRVVLPASFGP